MPRAYPRGLSYSTRNSQLATRNSQLATRNFFYYLCTHEFFGPIVQGIERKFPKLQIQVRVLVGLLGVGVDCLGISFL